jgi:hypothetical protein
MLDFNRGGQSAAPAAGQSRQDLPKATAWLNIGYIVTIAAATASDPEATEDRFVSLPVGIPLDTMEPLTINSRNTEFAQFQSARNGLLDQLKTKAASMKPGEECILALDGNTGLAVQLRRVNDAAPVPAADASNPFAATIDIG